MKKLFINENEKESILLLHKNFIKEQSTQSVDPDLQTLRDMVEQGCLRNGKIFKIKSTGKYIYRATSKTGKRLDFYADKTYEVFDPSTQETKKSTFVCNVKPTPKPAPQPTDLEITAGNQKIAAEGWMTYDEAKAVGLNLSDPKFYETTKINGKDYYKKKGISVGGAGSQEQTQVIEFLNDRYGNRFQRKLGEKPTEDSCWAFQGEQPRVEPQWTLTDVVGAEEYGVKEGLKIFVNPACISKIRSKSTGVVGQEIKYKNIDNKTCKDVLEKYLAASEELGYDTSSTAFQNTRFQAKACKKKFCEKNKQKSQGKCMGNWNLGMFGGSRKLDDIVDYFSGIEGNSIGTPEPYRSPFRLDM